MAMQTIPSRLTIWTSFKGLPMASLFFVRNAMTLRGVLTAQDNFKAHGAAH